MERTACIYLRSGKPVLCGLQNGVPSYVRRVGQLHKAAKDKAKMEKVIRENQYILDKETAKAILGMLGIKVNLNKIMVKTEKGVRYSMCKAIDDLKESGRCEGRLEGRREGERETLKKGLEAMINSLKKFSQDIEEIYNAVTANELYKNVTREQVEKLYYAK